LTVSLSAQQKSGGKAAPSSPQEVMPCSSAIEYLDFAMIGTRKLEGAYLIIIARLGAGETSSRLNKRRLFIVDEYIKRNNSDLKYVLAEGSRVNGLGRIELYVGGQLSYAMPLVKNARGYCFPGEGN
jgi:hypothetical protein